MSNLKRNQKLKEFKASLCPIMNMNCYLCVCKECPRDCSDCSKDGIDVGNADCLFMCIDRRGVNRYRGYNDEEDGWMNYIDLTKG